MSATGDVNVLNRGGRARRRQPCRLRETRLYVSATRTNAGSGVGVLSPKHICFTILVSEGLVAQPKRPATGHARRYQGARLSNAGVVLPAADAGTAPMRSRIRHARRFPWYPRRHPEMRLACARLSARSDAQASGTSKDADEPT